MARHWEDFTLGEVLVTGRRTIDGGDVSRFAGLTGDFNPLHIDAEFAKSTPFGERVAHGILTLAVSNGQQNLGGWFEGTTLALLGLDRLKFMAPVKFGDTVRQRLEVVEKKETSRADRGVVTLSATILNQRDEPVVEGQHVVLLRRRAG